MPESKEAAPSFYDKAAVCLKTTLSPTTLWRRVRDGKFPAPVRISDNRVAWPVGPVDQWIAEKSAPRAIAS